MNDDSGVEDMKRFSGARALAKECLTWVEVSRYLADIKTKCSNIN